VCVCVAQTRAPAVHLRVKQSEVEGTVAQPHKALDWRLDWTTQAEGQQHTSPLRWKIRGFLSFRLHELGPVHVHGLSC